MPSSPRRRTENTASITRVPRPPPFKQQPQEPAFPLCLGTQSLSRGPAGSGGKLVLEEPSSCRDLVRNSGGLGAWEAHASISDCAGCDRVRSPGGGHAFKVKVGAFHRNIGVSERAEPFHSRWAAELPGWDLPADPQLAA